MEVTFPSWLDRGKVLGLASSSLKIGVFGEATVKPRAGAGEQMVRGTVEISAPA